MLKNGVPRTFYLEYILLFLINRKLSKISFQMVGKNVGSSLSTRMTTESSLLSLESGTK